MRRVTNKNILRMGEKIKIKIELQNGHKCQFPQFNFGIEGLSLCPCPSHGPGLPKSGDSTTTISVEPRKSSLFVAFMKLLCSLILLSPFVVVVPSPFLLDFLQKQLKGRAEQLFQRFQGFNPIPPMRNRFPSYFRILIDPVLPQCQQQQPLVATLSPFSLPLPIPGLRLGFI